MGKYIVLDIVFYAGSLNYDQGSGNYQELKKITKWNGKQYSLVSRYALRYSILESAKNIVNWPIDDGEVLTTETAKKKDEEGGKGAIQPSPDALLSGKILLYPEFDLFGYLVTSTSPQNFKAAPVKISHAISMTPFNYDALFNANIGLANRLRKKCGELSPNPFTVEEHETYYLYSVVIDVNNIGRIDIYYNLSDKDNPKAEETYKNAKKEYDNKYKEIIEREEPENKKLDENLKHITYKLKEKNKEEYSVKGRVKGLIKTILNLKRSIKGREEDLSPKLLVVGIYNNSPYKTYKNNIVLVDEFTEEDYSEIVEKDENGKKIVQVKYKRRKDTKPLFRIENGKELPIAKINEKDVIEFVNKLLDEKSNEQHTKSPKNDVISEAMVFYDPTIEVEILTKCQK